MAVLHTCGLSLPINTKASDQPASPVLHNKENVMLAFPDIQSHQQLAFRFNLLASTVWHSIPLKHIYTSTCMYTSVYTHIRMHAIALRALSYYKLQPTFIDNVCNGLLSQSRVEGNHHSGVCVTWEGSHGPVDTVLRVDPKATLLSKWQADPLQTCSKVMCSLQHLAVLDEIVRPLPSLPGAFTKAGAIIWRKAIKTIVSPH